MSERHDSDDRAPDSTPKNPTKAELVAAAAQRIDVIGRGTPDAGVGGAPTKAELVAAAAERIALVGRGKPRDNVDGEVDDTHGEVEEIITFG